MEDVMDNVIDDAMMENEEQLPAKEYMRRKRKAAYQKKKAADKAFRVEQKETEKLEKLEAKKKRDQLLKTLLMPASELPETVASESS